MKKNMLRYALAAMMLMQSSVFASESSKMIKIVPDDLCINTSYMKTFDIDQSKGGSVEITVTNSGVCRVWIKVRINENYVYSKVLKKGESATYRGNSVEAKYGMNIESPTGERMETIINVVQY
ncbi:MAG: hypothetical protein ACRCW2_10815 [Cellulosilyticaceae bacterium]